MDDVSGARIDDVAEYLQIALLHGATHPEGLQAKIEYGARIRPLGGVTGRCERVNLHVNGLGSKFPVEVTDMCWIS